MPWRFLDYVNVRGENEIAQWMNQVPKKARAKIDRQILALRAFDIWPPQYVSALRGYKGIFELRIVASGVQYRPLGFSDQTYMTLRC